MRIDEPTITSPLLARPITREEARSLRGTLNSALRKTASGGPPRTCECGTCPKCRNRARVAAYRAK